MRTFSTILAAICCSVAVSAAETPLKVYDIAVAVDKPAQTLDIAIDLNMADYKPGRDRELIFTPVIIGTASQDSLELEPIVVAGRNRWYYHLRQGVLDSGDARIYRAATTERITVREQVPLEPWMDHCTVEMRSQTANCCSPAVTVPGHGPDPEAGLTELAVIDMERHEPTGDFVFAPPVDDAPVEKNIEGKAFISFVVNRTELKPDYMVNRREIGKIINSIDQVRNDPDAIITGVHIKGFASPEGSYTNNVRLAQGRTATLSEYVRDLYRFEPGVVTNSYEPEDWDGLRRYLTDSMDYRIEHRPQIIALVDSMMEPDLKDRTIRMKYPADYAVILKEIYPWLRHSDYTVRYRIKVFNTLPELQRAYDTDASRLRPVDFYTLAQQYPAGSDAFNDVMLRAVEVYPTDPMINLNVANVYLQRGDIDTAQKYLGRAGDSPEASYARGVAAARDHNWEAARRYFETARAAGIAQADSYISEIDDLDKHHDVTITATLTKNIK